jgi:hypothetical protein
MLKFLRLVIVLTIGMGVAGVANAGVKNHALPKVARAVGRVVAAAPKATAVALKDTLGGILFTVEAGVDVVHAGTSAINTAAAKELKHNPFQYVDEYVGKADSGLEKAYLFFFNAQI